MNAKVKETNSIDQWDCQYRNQKHMSRWPWSHLVGYVYRYCNPHSGMRVHELGCGVGANIPFFLDIEADYSACDGSEHAIDFLRDKYPKIAPRLMRADFSQDLGTSGPLDLIIDRASITHNLTSSIRCILDMVFRELRPGGIFLGVDWFATDSDDFLVGTETEDPYVRTAYSDGPFSELGLVHFSDQEHLLELFNHFEIIALSYRSEKTLMPGPSRILGVWDIVARRPV